MIEELGLETFIQPIHQSSLILWKKCPRKGFFRYRLGLVQKKAPVKEAAQLGQIVHKLLEVGPGNENSVRQWAMETVAEHIAAVEKGEDLLGQSLQAIQATEKNFNTAVMMASVFHEQYPENSNLETLCSEEYIADFFEMDSGVYWLAGTLDRGLRLKTDGTYWIKDFKTTTKDPDVKLAGYLWGPQLRMYRLLFLTYLRRTIDPEALPKGFIVNLIQAPTIRMGLMDRDWIMEEKVLTRGPRKGQTVSEKVYDGEPKFENYLKRCKEWYAENKEGRPIRSFMMPFVEPLVPRSFELALAEVSMWQKANCRKSLSELAEKFYPDVTGTSCSDFQSTCEYYPLCQRECVSWGHVIADQYRQETPEVYINEQGELVTKANKENKNDSGNNELAAPALILPASCCGGSDGNEGDGSGGGADPDSVCLAGC